MGLVDAATPDVPAAYVVGLLAATGDLDSLRLRLSGSATESTRAELVDRMVGRLCCIEGGRLGGRP